MTPKPVSIVGWSCRVPGANSIDEFWTLLTEGRCAISEVPPDRFNRAHFFHPERPARGRSYTWAAGVIDDVYGFDPLAFGISPREAPQLDPQQRILLQLTWEALEDAGIRPSRLAGTETGVYVGASLTEYAHGFIGDASAGDAHFATGNSLAVIANRISYIFDLHGPSVTFDTACSSSLVALNAACEALRSGRVETAIVAGINIISAPTSFISFSQASMVSPTGMCRAFSEGADGFVRAEGGAVFVLRRSDQPGPAFQRERGRIVASDVNSDGRTNGISLPSAAAQERLLRRVYDRAGISADQLAFVEAHGTGTPAGDPIEAHAIGSGLGQRRTHAALPIGSVKTNIGHLEAASGLAGVIKALLALKHGVLPPSLNFIAPNRAIDFTRLNIRVCDAPLALDPAMGAYAGVNSFGFGGTNAHAIVAAARDASAVAQEKKPPAAFVISAHSRAALRDLAVRYRDRIALLGDAEIAAFTCAAAHRRDALGHRLAISPVSRDGVVRALSDFIADETNPALTTGETQGEDLKVVFVYSGNGGQWSGMGRVAYRNNAAFKSRFDEIDALFVAEAGWSLTEALFDAELGARLASTSVAQPLVFAIQSSTTAALVSLGLSPHSVLGHSFGEVAAAQASGALDLPRAVKLIHIRSLNQESVQHRGRMAAVMAEPERIAAMLERVPGVEIAAFNGPRALTLAGPAMALARFAKVARSQGIPYLDLDLDYPFHASVMDDIRTKLETELHGIVPAAPARVPMISTVFGGMIDPSELTPHYWWQNVRCPVQFDTAIRAAAQAGGRIFVEIGPRGIMGKHIAAVLDADGKAGVALSAMERDDAVDRDPCLRCVAEAWTRGAAVDLDRLVGCDAFGDVALPRYPWQQTCYRLMPTVEAIGWNSPLNHPLSGTRFSNDALVWRSLLDTALMPDLAGHRVGDAVILPGTGFLEIALSAGAQALDSEDLRLFDLEILRPLDLTSETREVTTRISPSTQLIEIFSRARLAGTQQVLHARGRVARLPAQPVAADWPVGGRVIDGAAHYATADRCGLHYAGAFRAVERITLHDNTHITVDLAPAPPSDRYLLDPARLDCCAQGIIALFPGLMAEQRGVAYVPIRLEAVSLHRARGQPHRALIAIRHSNERTILADFTILDPGGDVVATLTGVTSQAIAVRRMVQLDAMAVIEKTVAADGSLVASSGVLASADQVAARVGRARRSKADDEASNLLDGFATMTAYELISALGGDGGICVAVLCAQGRWPDRLAAWLESALRYLQAAGLAEQRGHRWHLIASGALPDAASLLKTFAQDHPSHATSLLVAAELGAIAGRLSRGEDIHPGAAPLISAAAVDFDDHFGPHRNDGSASLHRLVEMTPGLLPRDRALRVLQIGYTPQVKRLAALGGMTLTVVEPDAARLAWAQAELAQTPLVTLTDILPQGRSFDLALASGRLGRLPDSCKLGAVAACLAADGMMIATEARRSFFRDMVVSLAAPDEPDRSGCHAASWSDAFRRAGFASVVQRDLADRSVIVAKSPAHGMPQAQSSDGLADDPPIVVVLDTPLARDIKFATRLEAAIQATGVPVVVGLGESGSPLPIAAENILLQMMPPVEDGDEAKALSQRCLALKAIADRIGTVRVRLFFLTSGAVTFDACEIDPTSSGIWAFARTLANELPGIDLRKVDVAKVCPAATAASRIAHLIFSGARETEVHVSKRGVRVVRVENAGAVIERSGPDASAVRLERRLSVHQRVAWQPIARRAPAPDEVEIAVAATGLNFRDLMFSMGMLPDDILEGGLAGATLGLECAGTIVACGDAVATFRVGDRVLAFAAAGFASHVTLPAAQLAKIPRRMSSEAAATIPVAFMTATYALDTLARLQPDEWVLIHGGAGAVGMAAVQVARAIGARVIATAGSPAKRALLQTMGAAHVLDSRSLAFGDEVARLAPGGVAVVLNSLAGEAMERSLACLAPFGRFIELGKRDYVANTAIGLRPFRKNLSYFGVDVDQIMTHRPALGRALIAEIMKRVADGTYRPLPFTVFDAREIAGAFQMMQQSAHVGKIVVRPPKAGDVRAPGDAFVVDPHRTHVVTGAFGGFGMATARWLADRGARHLVLIGRSGAASDEAQALVTDLERRGIAVREARCDVGDGAAVEALFAAVERDMPPVVGIIHAAMVLDDATLANVTPDQLREVFAPKVRGAIHLDLVSRRLSQLAYFVVYSSVTSLIGNPGQSAYVAANAFMEGLVRRRRLEGLPGLAIGWGPIADVGVVARSERLQASLARLGGARSLAAREALDLMAQALGVTGSAAELCVMTIAPREGLFGADRLPTLGSPTFAGLVKTGGQAAATREAVDWRALIAAREVEHVRARILETIVAQLAQVLHLRADDIVRSRPLSDMGLDSLMALELAMKLEDSFQIQIPLSGAAGDLTVASLVDEVLAHLDPDRAQRQVSVAEELVSVHFEERIHAAAE